jgi:hypothetical protein
MSANAQTQLVVSQVSTVSSIQFTSTLGQTWSTLSGATGLPSSLTTSYSAGAISGNGQYGLLAASGGYLYKTENAGASWTNTNPNTPIIYLPFETAPVNGATIGGTTLTVSPSVPALVPGIVGKTAVNLVNTPAGTATQYIRGSWTNGALTSFTVSLWFNLQSTTNDYSYIFSAFNAALSIVISSNVLSATIPIAASPYYTGVTIPTYQVIALNTWYNVTLIWQAAGSCYLYLNNVLYGSATGAGIFGGTTSNLFALSGFDTGPVNAFNGYIDDLKIYNTAISTTPFSPMVPQNWSNIAVSNSGQYMLATATGSGLFLSSNYGSTWTQVTSAMLYAAWTAAQVSATGQYLVANSPVVNVQPQLTGFTSSTAAQSSSSSTSSWQTGGVTWIASASSVLGSNPISSLFDNVYSTSWAGNSALYNSSGNTVAASTTIIGVTQSPSTTGDWIQLQSSVPLVMYSYQFANGEAIYQTPKIFYIAGSTDAVNWYPIQSASITSTTGTGSIRTLVPGMILVNSSGSQSFGSLSLTGTTYATTTNAYTYFRFIFTAIFSTSNDYLALSELVVNFQAGGQTYSTNYGLTWNNGYSIPSNVLALSPSGQTALSAPLITPQQTGLKANTWNQNGINWIASVSSSYTSQFQPWATFNNIVPSSPAFGEIYSWASAFNYLAGTGYNNANNTPLSQSGGAITSPSYGEWLQIQSSVPLVMYSYNFASGNILNIPKTYVIAGSLDGTTWFPLQSVNMGVTNPFTISNVPATSPPILINGPTSQMMNSTTITCTNYTTSTTAYTYFRIIANSVYGTTGNAVELEEWFVNFQNASGGTTYNVVPSLQAFSTGTSTSGSIPGVITGSAVSNTGQYMVVITNNTTGNNVYYSTNTGVIFTGLQLGSLVMTSCAISYDGSYITVSNATTVYQLNNNSTGYTVAVGNQAGLQNQAQNAIAIGNYAGTINQTANSIILNASGQGLNSVAQGFYVAPIASYTASSSPYFSIMGYGLDNQVTHSNGAISMLSNGNVGIGTTNPSALLHLFSSNNTITSSWATSRPDGNTYAVAGIDAYFLTRDNYYNLGGFIRILDVNTRGDYPVTLRGGAISFGTIDGSSGTVGNPAVERMRIAAYGFVGIGTTSPAQTLHVYGGSGRIQVESISPSSNAVVQMKTNNNTTYLYTEQSGALTLGTSNTLHPIVLQPAGGNVGIGTPNPTSVLQVVGTVTASTFLTTISSINTLPPINVRSIAATAPAVYLFSLTTTVLTINNPSDYARAIIYVSISSTGVIMQNVLVSVGIQINSYSAGQLSYNVGYSGNTVYTGGDSIVSLTRFL